MDHDALRLRLLRNSEQKQTGCREWLKGHQSDGYGVISINKRCLLAHRVAYEAFIGEIPHGMIVMHKCDNPSCINPEHLLVGSHQDNMRDRNTKGRARGKSWPGESHPAAKLTKLDVIAIKELSGKVSQKQIAARFGVTQGHISDIIAGKRWHHLGADK